MYKNLIEDDEKLEDIDSCVVILLLLQSFGGTFASLRSGVRSRYRGIVARATVMD